MVRSELIDVMSRQFSHLSAAQVEVMVNGILNVMVKTLMDNGRIEIRGFGTWCLRKRRSRNAHNPRTGKTIKTPESRGLTADKIFALPISAKHAGQPSHARVVRINEDIEMIVARVDI